MEPSWWAPAHCHPVPRTEGGSGPGRTQRARRGLQPPCVQRLGHAPTPPAVLLSLILLLPWGLEQVPKVSRGPSQFALGGKRGWGVTPKQGSGQGEGVLCLLGIGPFSDTPTRMGSQPSGAARSPPAAPADPHAHTEESGERLGVWAAGSHSGQGVGTGVYKAPVCCGCPARSQKHPRSSVSSTPFHCSGSCWVKHLHPLSSLQEPSLLFIR